MTDFGQRLKVAREERGITNGDFAKRCGIAQGTISNYERGHIVPGFENLKRIVQVLDC